MKFYFTFGIGTPLRKYYVEIEAASNDQARVQMYGMFGRKWASCYDETKGRELIEKYHYQRLDVDYDGDMFEVERAMGTL